jgi:hypothetical protein
LAIPDGTIVQGDGTNTDGNEQSALYLVEGGQRHLILDRVAFRDAGFDASRVQVLPDADVEQLPLGAERAGLAPGESITLNLDSFLGAGHYMTTWGVLRKTPSGGHIDATTRTRTVTWFGGFRGGVNIVYSDAQGFPVGQSATKSFGVDGTWIGRSDRTDYWSEELTQDWAQRTTAITILHFWDPNRPTGSSSQASQRGQAHSRNRQRHRCARGKGEDLRMKQEVEPAQLTVVTDRTSRRLIESISARLLGGMISRPPSLAISSRVPEGT